MPPKKANEPSKKTEQKKKEKIIEVIDVMVLCPIIYLLLALMFEPCICGV
jgi:hypothetical protein